MRTPAQILFDLLPKKGKARGKTFRGHDGLEGRKASRSFERADDPDGSQSLSPWVLKE